MKRSMFLLLVVLGIILLAGPVSAQNIPWGAEVPVHYNFTLTTTEGCAACHVTHTATVAKLLWGEYPTGSAPVTQTGFCYVCHAGLVGSPYNVEAGLISPDMGFTTTNSWAGYFGFDPGTTPATTSVHNVEDDITPGATNYAAADIPGNATADGISTGFKCASCHDPHAGDKPNDRLLKEKPLAGNTPVTTVNFNISHDTMAVVDYAYDSTGNDGLNAWCGQCHGKFNAANDDGRDGFMGKYRHPMGVDIDTTDLTYVQVYLGKKGTVASGNNLLNCLTCHKAHGTTVEANTDPWPGEDGSSRGPSSALLRLNKRGVCYDCHGAAVRNLEDYTAGTNY